MCVPVIASCQPSFEFIGRYDCGVLIDGPEEVPAATAHIAGRLDSMHANALDCARNYFLAPERRTELRDEPTRVLAA